MIVGGGFGGLEAARALAGAPVRVTVIDRRNHHLFQPLLYQVATASLNPSEIAAPIRRVLRKQENAEVVLGCATGVDTASQKVILTDGEVGYDYLILAAGAGLSYFGHEEWAEYAPGLKSIEDALEYRRRLLIAFEAAEREEDPDRRERWLTFVIVGGGPTGVELAGALAEIRRTLRSDFRRIDPRTARIILLEGVPRILPTLPERLSKKAAKQLEKLGVKVLTGSQVTAIDDEGVKVGDKLIGARTVFWAAGVAASPLARGLGAPLDRAGRVKVRADLTAPGFQNVFVIGDLAYLEQDGKLVPGVAPAAIQQGRHAASNIRRLLSGMPTEPFRYVDKGTLATIGRAAAVADIRGLQLSGVLAWLAWLAVHIWFLIGFRNRFVVMLEWARAYVLWERQVRLITDEVDKVLDAAGQSRDAARAG
ncbi:MAG: NAD(P)/FAD-dependent oxidoreductase [Actinomycetota bacterium]|nr:NAD(P)/FAD-dependent oxidoreductase [Actinomycetota bacterium]